MKAAVAQLVWRRARRRCEYCRMPQDYDETPFEIDHIISRKHGGQGIARNLALSCFHCNAHKGSNIGGRDPNTHAFTSLFNPRRHKWERHFRWQGAYLLGRTAIGRVTAYVLNLNDPLRVELREELRQEGITL